MNEEQVELTEPDLTNADIEKAEFDWNNRVGGMASFASVNRAIAEKMYHDALRAAAGDKIH